jgi:hypothetical protein
LRGGERREFELFISFSPFSMFMHLNWHSKIFLLLITCYSTSNRVLTNQCCAGVEFWKNMRSKGILYFMTWFNLFFSTHDNYWVKGLLKWNVILSTFRIQVMISTEAHSPDKRNRNIKEIKAPWDQNHKPYLLHVSFPPNHLCLMVC